MTEKNLQLNRFIQKAIIEFDNSSINQCDYAKDNCYKCDCQEICWTYCDLQELNLKVFK